MKKHSGVIANSFSDYSNAQGADVVRKTLTEAELSRFTNDDHTIWLLK